MGALYNEVKYNEFIDYETVIPPKGLKSLYKNYKVGRLFLEQDRDDNPHMANIINSKKDLDEYLELAAKAAVLIRSKLPKNPFDSEIYRNKYDCTRWDLEKIETGSKDVGLNQKVTVFAVRRDFFNLTFVKEGDEMKIVSIGYCK